MKLKTGLTTRIKNGKVYVHYPIEKMMANIAVFEPLRTNYRLIHIPNIRLQLKQWLKQRKN